MSIIKEFKEFIIKGNAIDLAVGLIIGAAFGVVVKSLVDDILMPPLGYAIGQVDFSQLAIKLGTKLDKAGHPVLDEKTGAQIPAVVISYGKFINSLIALTIQGFAIFMVVKLINKLKRQEEIAPTAPPPTPEDVLLLREIRDSLKK